MFGCLVSLILGGGGGCNWGCGRGGCLGIIGWWVGCWCGFGGLCFGCVHCVFCFVWVGC